MELPDWLSKLIALLLAIAALYFALAGLLDPDYVFSNREKRILEKIGPWGLSGLWLLAALGCVLAIYKMSKKSNKNDRK